MFVPILATKLFIPPPRPRIVVRPRLIERLHEGLRSAPGVTLISAPAGFGKTTLLSTWIYGLRLMSDDLQGDARSREKIVNPKSEIVNRVAWLSLDEGDGDLARFLSYLIAALQTITPTIGEAALALLQAVQSQPPPIEAVLISLLNEISTSRSDFVLILDDYHTIDAQPVHD